MGGCGWIRCTRNPVLSDVAQDMVCFWLEAVASQCAQILAILGAFWGHLAEHIVELEGRRGPLSTEKSSYMCRVATISLLLAVSSRVVLGKKRADFGPELQIVKLWSGIATPVPGRHS